MSQVPTRQSPKAASSPPPAPATRRARGTSQIWPHDLLEVFCLRMSSHGMCVSRALMQHDHRHGLEQLSHAHSTADDALRVMAAQMFRHFEARQSGISAPH